MRGLLLSLLLLMTPMVFSAETADPRQPRPGALPLPTSDPSAPQRHQQTTLLERANSKVSREQETATRRQPVEQQVMQIRSVFPHCIQPGGLMSLQGNGLSALKAADLALKNNTQTVLMQSLSITDQQANYRVPEHEVLKANQQFKLMLIQPDNMMKMTGNVVEVCAEQKRSMQKQQDYEPGQALMLIASQQQVKVKHQLENMGYQLMGSESLDALQQTLLIVAVDVDENLEAIQTLRLRFPEAIIDLNSHFKAMEDQVRQPRLYAKKQLAWQFCQSEDHQISIGLIDGQVDIQHPALQQQDIISKRFLNPIQKVEQAHATAIASILFAEKPEWGLEGLLSGNKLFSAEVLRIQNGESRANLSALIRAIDWLLEQQVRLINVSLASPYDNQVLGSIIRLAIQKGSIIFAAAGNNAKQDQVIYPAAIDGVIAVTALDAANRVYNQANQGPFIDFSAPGVDIWTAESGAIGKYRSGTSYAVPYALAVAANYFIRNPSLPRDIVFQAMKNSAMDLGRQDYDPVFGWGLLQATGHNCRQ